MTANSLEVSVLRCIQCDQHKPIDAFHRSTKNKANHGREYRCKECRKNRFDPSRVTPTKVCTSCGQEKLRDEFHNMKASPDGKKWQCAACSCQAMRRYAEQHPEKVRKTKQNWRAKMSPEELYRWDRNVALKQKFGITLEQYEAMETEQGGVCAVCGDREEGKVLVVDHDHETKVIRALLCGLCNRALGLLKEQPQRALALAKYMETF